MNRKLLIFQFILSIIYLFLNSANSYYGLGTWNLNRTIGWEFDFTNFILYKSIGSVLIIVLLILLVIAYAKSVKLNKYLNYLIIGFTFVLSINNLVNKDLFFHYPAELLILSSLTIFTILVFVELVRNSKLDKKAIS